MKLAWAFRQAAQSQCKRASERDSVQTKRANMSGWGGSEIWASLHPSTTTLSWSWRSVQSLSRDQALQLWISEWTELSSKLWSESPLCCRATARNVAMHTKPQQRLLPSHFDRSLLSLLRGCRLQLGLASSHIWVFTHKGAVCTHTFENALVYCSFLMLVFQFEWTFSIWYYG